MAGEVARYSCFGLQLSAQIELPLSSALARARADVEVELTESPPGSLIGWQPSLRTPRMEVWSRSDSAGVAIRFEFLTTEGDPWDGRLSALVTADGAKVSWSYLAEKPAHPARQLVVDAIVPVLTGVVLGSVCRLRGRAALHASSVVRERRAVAFAGLSGRGKSTIAAALLVRGWQVLSDDIVSIDLCDGAQMAQPGPPSLGLVPRSLQAAGTPEAELGRASLVGEKHRLRLAPGNETEGGAYSDRERPLAVVYDLQPRSSSAVPCIEPVTGMARLETLIRSIYLPDLPLSPAQRATELSLLAGIASAVPIRRLTVPDDLEALPAVCDAVEADVASLPE